MASINPVFKMPTRFYRKRKLIDELAKLTANWPPKARIDYFLRHGLTLLDAKYNLYPFKSSGWFRKLGYGCYPQVPRAEQ